MADDRSERNPRQVVVTGLGIVSPLGGTADEHWRNVLSGLRAVRWLTSEELGPCGPASAGWSRWAAAPARGIPLPAPMTVLDDLVSSAASEALAQASLSAVSAAIHRERAGVVVGVSKPAIADSLRAEAADWECPFDALSSPAANLARRLGFAGAAIAPSVACATGLMSHIRGAQLIADDSCDVVLAGSADWSLHPAYLAAYRRMGVLADPGDDPARACRPFDRDRRGFMVGSGAAMLVLEEREHALSRGARPLVELAGWGMAGDAMAMVETDVAGTTPARCIVDALRRAGVTAEDVDAVSLHGTGTPANDLCETAALKQALGSRATRVSCFSLKGAIGHLMGAAGSVEAATLIQSMLLGVVPTTVNLDWPDPACDLDYTAGGSRERMVRTGLKLSLGFGGACAALVLRRSE